MSATDRTHYPLVMKSLGSLVGTLASVNARTMQVELQTELDDRRVPVSIGREQIDTIRDNLDRRVLVSGELTRNAAGQILAMRAEKITPWQQSKRRLSESGGLARGYLGDEGPVEHLERVGGWRPSIERA